MSKYAGDDYSTSRVPQSARRPMSEVLLIRLGTLACVSQLLVGAALGYGLTFWQAFWATIFGSVLLQLVGWLMGVAACKEGLSTSLLSRWAGLGKVGSALLGAVIMIALMGWFGVQNGLFATGMFAATGLFNVTIWAAITGIAVTAITVYGYRWLSYTANLTVPLFLLAIGWATLQLLHDYRVSDLIKAHPAGPPLTMAAAITVVAGGFIIGAVITPDISRYLKQPKDVFWMTLISTFVGELVVNGIAVLMALALYTADIVTLMLSLAGWLGAAIVLTSTVKLNAMNLYSSSLGLSTLYRSVSGRMINRGHLTWAIGISSSLLSMLGILQHFVTFLIVLGVSIPPVAGIMIVDYYILRRDRQKLDETRLLNQLPQEAEWINPIALFAWISAFLCGLLIDQGVPAINSLLFGGGMYWLTMTLYARYKKVAVARFSTVRN